MFYIVILAVSRISLNTRYFSISDSGRRQNDDIYVDYYENYFVFRLCSKLIPWETAQVTTLGYVVA